MATIKFDAKGQGYIEWPIEVSKEFSAVCDSLLNNCFVGKNVNVNFIAGIRQVSAVLSFDGCGVFVRQFFTYSDGLVKFQPVEEFWFNTYDVKFIAESLGVKLC